MKFLSKLLLIVLVIGMFSGCGGSNEVDEMKETTEVTESKSDLKEDGEEVGDVNGRGNITVTVYDRGKVPPEVGTITDNPIVDWINENGPVDVSFVSVPRWESKEKINLLFASGDAPDLIYEYDTAIKNQLYSQGLLMPLDDMIEKYSTTYKKILEDNPAIKKMVTKPDGHMYEFARALGTSPNHTLFIRTDWLEKLNLEVPKTEAEFYEVAKAFAERDPDGNGIDDTYGYNMSFIGGYIIDAMFNNYTVKVKDDSIVPSWENAEAALRFRKRLYDEGIVDRDFALDKNGEKAVQDFLNGKLGIYAANNGYKNYSMIDSFYDNNPEAKLDVIALPSTSMGTYGPITNALVGSIAVVNAETENPKAIMEYFDFMIQEEVQKYIRFGEEGVHYEVIDGLPINNVTPEMEERYTQEFEWTTDFRMSAQPMVYESDFFSNRKVPKSMNNYEEKAKFMEQSFKYYVESGAMNLELRRYLPALPDDLVQASVDTDVPIDDIYLQSVLSGDSYSVEQAMSDAKTLWSISGGDELIKYYDAWYKQNKDTAFLPEDNY